MEKTRCLFNTQKKVLLSRSDKNMYGIFMEAITEKVEQQIDKQGGAFQYRTLDGHIITDTNTYLYGEIDLNNPKDIKYLMRFKNAILNPYDYNQWYYTSFDYDTGEIKANDENIFKGINFIADPIKWFKYKYCILGKPERIIIYKQRIVQRLES